MSLETQFLFSLSVFQFRYIIMYFHVSIGLRKGYVKEEDHFGYLGVNGRIILRCIEIMGRALIIILTQDRVMAGSCEHGTELSVSIKYSEFLDWLRN